MHNALEPALEPRDCIIFAGHKTNDRTLETGPRKPRHPQNSTLQCVRIGLLVYWRHRIKKNKKTLV